MNESEKQDRRPGSGLVGFLIVSLCAIGLIGAFGALAAMGAGNYVGAGVCAIGSALPFGFLLHTLFKK